MPQGQCVFLQFPPAAGGMLPSPGVPTAVTLYVNSLVMSTRLHLCILVLIKMPPGTLCGTGSLLCIHQAVGYYTSLPHPWNAGPGWAAHTQERGDCGPLLGLIVGLDRSVLGVELGGHEVGRGRQGSEFQAGNLGFERPEAHILRTLLEGFSGLSKNAEKNFQAKGRRHQKP